jgi:hypothetical protein
MPGFALQVPADMGRNDLAGEADRREARLERPPNAKETAAAGFGKERLVLDGVRGEPGDCVPAVGFFALLARSLEFAQTIRGHSRADGHPAINATALGRDANPSPSVGIKSAGKPFARARDRAAFFTCLRPVTPAETATAAPAHAKVAECRVFAADRRKLELHRTPQRLETPLRPASTLKSHCRVPVRRRSDSNPSLSGSRTSLCRSRQFLPGKGGPVAGLVGIEGGVVSGVINLESPSV